MKPITTLFLFKLCPALALLIGLVLTTACSYEPEKDETGQCKLTCSNAIIGASDAVYTIKWKTLASATECTPQAGIAATPLGPFRADFLIGETIADESGGEVGVMPVPNISIEPLLIGNRPKQNNANDGTEFQGLATLRDNWCSDACGMVTLQAFSMCPGPGTKNDLSIQIHTGALHSDQALFPISTKELEQ